MKNNESPIVGIAIATFNRKDRLKECLNAINNSTYKNIIVSVLDDASSDGTWEMLDSIFPNVQKIRGNGNMWWGGGTNMAIKKCLDLNCDFIILLNDDCIIKKDTISKFLERSKEFPNTVICPITLNILNPKDVWWAGSTWGPLKSMPFIWLIRQKFKHNTSVCKMPDTPYETCEFTGRGIFIPKKIFDSFGLIDAKTFPQYGSDTDFSLRISTGGGKAIIDPNNSVLLYTEDAGQNTSGNFLSLPYRFFKLLFYRKHGEAAIFWWHLLKRHAPWYAFIPSYIFIITLTFLRVFRILPIINKIIGNEK